MRRGFTIHHNGPPADCIGEPHSRCVSFWNAVRRYHTAPEPTGRGWSDIAYSFGVCPHGERLPGRGWDRAQWANGSDDVGAEDGRDSEWYSVLVFVGGAPVTGDTEPPTPEMVAATAALIGEGRTSGRCGRRVTPHNFWKQKPCPGPEFTALAKAWDNADLVIPGRVPPPAPEPKEIEMFIVDTEGKPALIVGVGGVKRINGAQRGALRAAGVEARPLSPAENDAMWSLREAAPAPAHVDVVALADALAGRLDGLDGDEMKAALREVFIDAGTAG